MDNIILDNMGIQLLICVGIYYVIKLWRKAIREDFFIKHRIIF